MKLKAFFLLLLLGGLFSATVRAEEDSEPLWYDEISENERLILEKFFQLLIKSDGLGYVLFGSKPVCMTSYFSHVPLGNMLYGSHASYGIKAGWNVWKRYEKYFSHPRYLIFEEVKNVEGIEIHSLFFIHKGKLLETLEKHKKIFTQELGSHFGTTGFLETIEKKQALFEVLNHHEGLLGILLGYGVESAMNYHKRELVWKKGLPLFYEDTDLQGVTIDSSFKGENIQSIHFVGNPQSSEVNGILEQNSKEKSSLAEMYSQGHFLEISLKKLSEPL